jgi:hypothetical protein
VEVQATILVPAAVAVPQGQTVQVILEEVQDPPAPARQEVLGMLVREELAAAEVAGSEEPGMSTAHPMAPVAVGVEATHLLHLLEVPVVCMAAVEVVRVSQAAYQQALKVSSSSHTRRNTSSSDDLEFI